jgi:hypothetical protein
MESIYQATMLMLQVGIVACISFRYTGAPPNLAPHPQVLHQKMVQWM